MSFRELTSALSEHFGWELSSEAIPRIEAGVAELSKQTGIDAQETVRRALAQVSQLRMIAARLSVPESFFFRGEEQLLHLAKTVQAKLRIQGRTVTIWSAGCSRGEEPYSICFLLSDLLSRSDLANVRIFANDVDERAVDTARKGVYNTWSLRERAASRCARYFKKDGDGAYVVPEAIRKMVRFHFLSIQEMGDRLSDGQVDFILCRNVFIYFNKAARKKVMTQFERCLHPEGFIYLAPNDPVEEITGLTKGEDPTAAFLCKTQSDGKPSRFEGLRDGKAADTGTASNAHSQSFGMNKTNGHPSVAARDLNKESERFFKEGQRAISAGDMAGAIEYFRQSVFYDPEFHLARFWYAKALERIGAGRRAALQLHRLMNSLQTSARPLAGVSEEDLRKLALVIEKRIP